MSNTRPSGQFRSVYDKSLRRSNAALLTELVRPAEDWIVCLMYGQGLTQFCDTHCYTGQVDYSARQLGILQVSIFRVKKSASPRDNCSGIQQLGRGAEGQGQVSCPFTEEVRLTAFPPPLSSLPCVTHPRLGAHVFLTISSITMFSSVLLQEVLCSTCGLAMTGNYTTFKVFDCKHLSF